MAEPVNLPRALGRQMSLHTGLYGLNAVITFVFGIVNVAVLTRFLDLEEFAEWALLLFFSTLVTVVANLATLQGSFLWVFGATGEEGAGVADAWATATDKRSALTTGLVLTICTAAFLVGASILLAEPAARVVTGDADHVRALELAAVSGGLGAVWRFAVNVMRYERRPAAFVLLGSLRPAAVLGVSIPLVASGGGVTGALVGVAAGTGFATVAALIATRRSYGLRLDLAHAAPIVRAGAFLVPVFVSFWIVQNVDLYLVSLFAADADVARYRVASRVGAGVSYFASAFLMAWMPLTRTVLHAAVERDHGVAGVTSTIVTYFVAACLWIILSLAVLADLLIRIAPSTYESAAPLIPLIGLGFATYGTFVVLYRGARIRAKRTVYMLLAAGAAIVFLGSALALTPAIGVYGAAVAPIVGFGLATAVLLYLSQRGTEPIPFEYGRLARAGLIAGACLSVNVVLAPLLGDWRIGADAAILAVFPVLLARVGVINLDDLREIGRDFLRPRRSPEPQTELEPPLPEPGSPDRLALDLLIDRRCSAGDVAWARGLQESEVLAGFVRMLRQTSGSSLEAPADEAIGRYLLSSDGVAERDGMALKLLRQGVEPGEILQLESAREMLRKRKHAEPAGMTLPSEHA